MSLIAPYITSERLACVPFEEDRKTTSFRRSPYSTNVCVQVRRTNALVLKQKRLQRSCPRPRIEEHITLKTENEGAEEIHTRAGKCEHCARRDTTWAIQ
jgi:hypothetical protein